MGTARVASRAQIGLSAPRVEVEVHLGGGLPTFSIVGLPAVAVKESKDRVRAALVNSGFDFPAGRITVNLSPADLPKEGCRYDLPIALGILLASSQIRLDEVTLEETEFYGELGLAGELKPVKGVLLAAAHARRESRRVVVPAANLAEAKLAEPVAAHGARTLLAACDTSRIDEQTPSSSDEKMAAVASIPDLADVRGQASAKRALLIAAAGGHSLLLIGPPGTGKSMLAQRLPGLLPPLRPDEALDVAAIASVTGRGFDVHEFGKRPFRAPHHSASASAIIGGGPRALPGEVSLAHRGVLFLDELPEFNRAVLESLREPLESGHVSIARAALRVEYPARFQLVAAMNPCPCGYLGDNSGRCRCPPGVVARYRSRVSGPLLDRIDLRVEVPALSSEELLEDATPADGQWSSARVAERIRAAHELQIARSGLLNAALVGRDAQKLCRLDLLGKRLLGQARAKLGMSARGIHRVLRVARTIGDLENETGPIGPVHLAEAMQLRRAIE